MRLPSGWRRGAHLGAAGAISGTIVVDGREVTSLRGRELAAYRRTIGFVTTAKTTIMIATHDEGLADRSDQIVQVRDGKVVSAVGPGVA
ncbi:hypothetical protein [Salinispora cortesiana]|uniref:hypothetical protein n=1 Tax=Salinispora cortesiana TaxID=1305843 RepID=UPI0003FD6B5C|nr:hypothetical protein [Salinispora cortesiana]